MEKPKRGRGRPDGAAGTPALEWIAAGTGLALTLAMLGFIGWKAYEGTGAEPPAVTVVAERVSAVPGGYVVEIKARNHSSATAAAVQIEGTVNRRGGETATSQAVLDYIPGNSEQRGGLFFTQDPRGGELSVRALGYAEP